MECHRTGAAILGAAFLLAGCSFSLDDVWPSLTGDDSVNAPPPARRVATGPAAADQQPTATPASTVMAPTPQRAPVAQVIPAAVTPTATAAAPIAEQTQPFGATGTFGGAKVAQLARELETLAVGINTANTRFQQRRAITEQNALRYYVIAAAISARLQIGTTPGNPVLVSQWNMAQSELDRILADVAALNTLANDVASQAALSTYLIASITAAYGLSGAVEEDHRRLAEVEDEVNRTVVLIDRLLDEVNDTIARQTSYVNNERRNLTTLSLAIKNGEMFGPSLANHAFAAATPATQRSARTLAQSSGAAAAPGAREPLVIIRFDRPDVPYQQALYSAVSQALERRPASTFDVVAIATSKGSPAEVALNTNESKRNAERVFRTLTEMGLPGDRVTLSATASGAVKTNEVHIYVR